MAPKAPMAYQWRGGAVLRVSTDPGGLAIPPDLDLTGPGGERERAWLAEVWQRAEVRDALAVASPVLVQQVTGILGGGQCDQRRLRKIMLSVTSYLLRWQRPTPFGLFAGVAPVSVGAVPLAEWGDKHQATVRADAEWLAEIVTRLQRCPELLERLPVVANDSAQVRGKRVVAPGPPVDGHALLMAPVEVSVRRSTPVAAALDVARSPIRFGELYALLASRALAADAGRIRAMLTGLLEQHLLVSSLWAPMTSVDALCHVCAELHAAGAREVPAVAALVDELAAIHRLLTVPAPAAEWPQRGQLVERMRALAGVAPVPLVVDTAVDCEVRFPPAVIREVEEAVAVVHRLTPYPFGYPAWRDYHSGFRARYGAGAVVRVLDTVAAQLSFAPRRRRNENVARTAQLLEHVIPLAEHRAPGEGVIALADLAVTADARCFHLVQLSTGRRVEPRVLHALEAGVHTPPMARFLAEITTARSAVYKGFDFGAAARLPYLPRVRHGRTVVFQARWLLTAGDLPARTAPEREWQATLQRWRERLRVPERIALVEHDQRLPLDLTHPVHRALLRSRLDGTGRVELRETSAPQDMAWIGRAHEVLLPLVLHQPAQFGPPPRTDPVRVAAGAGHLPGRSRVLHARLHGHPGRFDELLTEHLPDLLNALGDGQRWWFKRHREMARPDSDQYLALYLHLPSPDAYGQAAEKLHDWAEQLRRQRLLARLLLVDYEPQEGRYGHGATMDAAHAVFAADSLSAVAQIRAAAAAGIPAQALTAASLLDLTTHLTGSPEQARTWLIGRLPRHRGRVDRALHDHALALADRQGAHHTLRALPGGTDIAAAWQQRATALTDYRRLLAAQRDPLTVARSLLHGHHVRALGVDPDIERLIGHLARSAALRHSAIHREAR
ncbi:lantibiotic dehydratase [Kitasatospora sp. NPDC092286]|uniref:lantibiotic dehydratase n=1 Tax=Kitasatospora sp. NPDC092286 TaxID=3364087 RepID=UPI0037F6F175